MKRFLLIAGILGLCWSYQHTYAQPAAGILPASASICAGDSLTFTSSSSGVLSNQGFLVDLSPDTTYVVAGVGPITLTFDKPGVDSVLFFVAGTGGTDTAISVITILPRPLADAGPDLSRCPDGPGAFLNGGLSANNQAPGPFLYEWFPSTGLSDSIIPSPLGVPDTTTLYTLTVLSSNGCNSLIDPTDSISHMTFTVLPKPFVDAGPDLQLCAGDSLMLNGIAGGAGSNYSFFWTGPTGEYISDPFVANPIIAPTQNGIYTVVVTANGCDSDADSAQIWATSAPPVTTFADTIIEEADSLLLIATPITLPPIGPGFIWEPDSLIDIGVFTPGDAVFIPSDTGIYLFTVRGLDSLSGCVGPADTLIVTVIPSAPIAPKIRQAANGDGIEVELASVRRYMHYFWVFIEGNDTTFASVQSLDSAYTAADLEPSPGYTGFVALGGENDGDSVYSEFFRLNATNSLRFLGKDSGQIFPVPATKTCILNLPAFSQPGQLHIYDVQGRLVEAKSFGPRLSPSQETISIENWNSGIYHLVFSSSSQRVVYQLWVE